MLLDDTSDVAEIFCEHHEDILIKYSNGLYSGLQVKTRDSAQEPWKLSDEAIKVACVRFTLLESTFPGRFSSFKFLTNHLFHSAKNDKDFCHVLQKVKMASSFSTLSKSVKKFLLLIATEAKCELETTIKALSKTTADNNLPKLSDVEMRLINELAYLWPRASECVHVDIIRAARALIFECIKASSLAHLDFLPAYLSAMSAPVKTEFLSRIAMKRFDCHRVIGILNGSVSNNTALLAFAPENCIMPGVGDLSLLNKKLEAGGFSVVTCNYATDLRDKADYLGLTWIKKYGSDEGRKRYEHVKTIVHREAVNAYESNKNDINCFGKAMLSELRSQLRLLQDKGNQIFDCSTDHLEGLAYSLTSQCKIQWSIDRPWEIQ
jgi:hypothetical protein